MELDEAMKIAYEGDHAAVTFDLAANVIRFRAKGRDQLAYAQLAEIKAALQRLDINWKELV